MVHVKWPWYQHRLLYHHCTAAQPRFFAVKTVSESYVHKTMLRFRFLLFSSSLHLFCTSFCQTYSLSLSLSLPLRSVCSEVPLYLSAFVTANVLKWREIKAGKPCVSHTNSSPCGPIGSQHAYWWRHTAPSLCCASTSPSHLWQEPARSTPSHTWNIHAEHRDNLSYWGTHTYAQTYTETRITIFI